MSASMRPEPGMPGPAGLPGGPRMPERSAWRRALDARIDDWMTRPAMYRWAIGNVFTRWLTRRRASALFRLMAGFVHSQVLLACVQLRILERVRVEPLTLDDIAAHSDIPAPALERLLRSAVAIGLLEPRGGGRFGLGPLGAPVAADPGLRDMICHNAVLYDDLRDPLRLMREQSRSAMHAYWLYTHGNDAESVGRWQQQQVRDYSDLMASSQRFVIEELLSAYDFSGHRCVLDVGGGKGGWIVALARRHPHLQLMHFDLPPVSALARANFEAQGVADRVQAFGGSFSSDPLPVGADLVTLLRVAHDHPDHVVRTILAAIHDALPRGGTLVLAEPMAETPGTGAVADPYFHFYLMAMGLGRLRTADELMALIREAGFDQVEQVANPMPMHAGLLVARKTQGRALAPAGVRRSQD